MPLEQHGRVALAVSRTPVSSFVRVIEIEGGLRIVAANGHTCGWDSGVEEIARALLDAVEAAHRAEGYRERARTDERALFACARAAFLRVAAPYAEDDDVGGPAASLTLATLADGRVRLSWLGSIEALVFGARGRHRTLSPDDHGVLLPGPYLGRQTSHDPPILDVPVETGDALVLRLLGVGGTIVPDRELARLAARGASAAEIVDALSGPASASSAPARFALHAALRV